MIKVSVIIPTFNYAQYIRAAVESVLSQEYNKGSVELIVVDDGSTDDTHTVLEPFISAKQITYHFQPNAGKAQATSRAVNLCTGKYIFNLDADDYFLPGKIDAYVRIFEEHPEVVHIGAPALYCFEQSGKMAEEQLPVELQEKVMDGLAVLQEFYRKNFLLGGGSTYAARASVLKQIKIPKDVDMYIDEFLILSVLLSGKSYFFGQPFSVWRIHQSNYSGTTCCASARKSKVERSLRSSHAIMVYLEANPYPEELKRIYRLQNSTRQIASKESMREKSLSDILRYAVEVFCRIRPRFSLLRNYHVLPRLLPTVLLLTIKGILTWSRR